MGQYYSAYLEKSGRKDEYEVYSGSKLMEIAIYDEEYMTFIMSRLIDSPRLVAFIGDYARDVGDAFGPFSHRDYIVRYNRTWKDDNYRTKTVSEDELKKTDEEYGKIVSESFILNNTKGVYIDMGRYALSSWRDWKGRLIHPLPLLTACGNGRGCGDYEVWSALLMEKVGTWAFDEITVRTTPDTIPPEYRDVTESVLFYEDGR